MAGAQQATLDALANAVTLLTHQFAQAYTNASSKSVIQRPAPFNGQGRDDARRFLAAFDLWAGDQKALKDANGNFIAVKWVSAFITFLTDAAAYWAMPIMEKINAQTFTNTINEFKTAFKARFDSVDAKVDAWSKLETLKQDDKTVPKYAALFNQYSDIVGISDGDKWNRFRKGLNEWIKDDLARTEKDHSDLGKLIDVATSMERRKLERQAEKARDKGQAPKATSTPHAFRPFQPASVVDPNAMVIDASVPGNGKTRDHWRQAMRGKCYGCGDQNHVSANCPSKRTICSWCNKVGHTDQVCMNRYLGRPKGASRTVVAATNTASVPQGNTQNVSSPALTTSTDTSAMNNLASQVSQLVVMLGQMQQQGF